MSSSSSSSSGGIGKETRMCDMKQISLVVTEGNSQTNRTEIAINAEAKLSTGRWVVTDRDTKENTSGHDYLGDAIREWVQGRICP